MLHAGALSHRVTLQARSVSRDAVGGETVTWTTHAADVPARIEPLAARELMLAQQVHPELTTRITIAWVSGVTAHMRVLYGSRVFAIHGPPIDVEMKQMQLVLNCSEGPLVE